MIGLSTKTDIQMRAVYSSFIPTNSFGKRQQFLQIRYKKCKDKDELYFSYNHGHKSWDTFAFLGRFPIQTGPIPPSPYKQCWTRVSRIFFSEFQLCIGWREGALQENSEKVVLF